MSEPRSIRRGGIADRLIRRLRVSDPPERFQSSGRRPPAELLGVEAVAWVPDSPRARCRRRAGRRVRHGGLPHPAPGPRRRVVHRPRGDLDAAERYLRRRPPPGTAAG